MKELSKDALLQEIKHLRKQQELLSSSEMSPQEVVLLLKHLHAGVVVHASDTRILYSNPAARHLLGLTKSQLLGKQAIDPDWNFISEEGQRLSVESYPVNRIIHTRKPLVNQIIGVRHPQNPVNTWLMVNGVPFFLEDGTLERIIVTFLDITDQKMANEKIIASEKRLSTIIDATPAGICITDQEGFFEQVNPAYCNIYKYQKSELIGQHFTIVVPAENRELLSNLHDRFISSGAEIRGEWDVIDKQGDTIAILADAARITGTDGQPRKATFVMDITDMKKAEREIRKLSQAVEQSPASVIITDANGDIEYVNRQFCHATGYSTDEVIGKNPRILKSGYHPSTFYEEMWQTLITGKTWRGEICNNTRDGNEIWESAAIATVTDDSGSILNYVAVKEDVTARKAAEIALKENEALLQTVTNTAQDAIAMINSRGIISFWNPAAEKMFGYSSDETIGKDIHLLLASKQDQQKAHTNLPLFSKNGKGAFIGTLREVETHTKDGTPFTAELSIASILIKNEWFAVGSIRDISDRKRAEAKLLEMATQDGLTHLYNRRFFLELGTKALAKALRQHTPLSFIMFDADHFKQVNDHYGHDIGDAVLIRISEMARETFREMDIIGRIGGEEFAVLLPDTSLDGAYQVAERLRLSIANDCVKTEKGTVGFTISIGISALSNATKTLELLMKQADLAMYEAKKNGRNRVEYAKGENL